MDLYREKVQYGTGEWEKLTHHKKTWGVNGDGWGFNQLLTLLFNFKKYYTNRTIRLEL